MVTVITYGTFDLFHIGHLRLFERAAALGDQLVVGVSSDEFNLEKRKYCVQPYSERARIVAALRVVDDVFTETNWEQKIDDIKRYQANVFVIGDDWKGHFDFLKEYCSVCYLERTPGVSTSDRKEYISTDYVAISQNQVGIKDAS
jgi:glycerol-3-phosphate cytidylyltransferase